MKKFYTMIAVALFGSAMVVAQNHVATFENEAGGINLTAAESAWQGADVPVDGRNEWTSGDYTFSTYVDAASFYYSEFTVSNQTANTSTGWAEPYRSAKGGAYEGANFAVWNMNYYGIDTITFTERVVPGFYVNNNAYAVTSMLNGDSYAKKFDETDWFVLYCIGLKNNAVVDTVEVYLAKAGEIMTEWTYVDLSVLGAIDAMTFGMNSSDCGDYGMNTPAYFCMDNFGAERPAAKVATFENEEGGIQATAENPWLGAAEPEPGLNIWTSGDYAFSTFADASEWGTYYYAFTVSADPANTSTGFMEPYRSAAGGAAEGNNFCVWYYDYNQNNSIMLASQTVPGVYVCNNAYAVTSMVNGDNFAKAFGKDDYFVLTLTGKLNGETVKALSVDLARDGKYMDKWTYISLSELGLIDEIELSLSSSDNGDYGMNTPAYVCIDALGAAMPEGYVAPEMAEFPNTAISNTATATPATKIVENGQVFIIKNGVRYNLLGGVVR